MVPDNGSDTQNDTATDADTETTDPALDSSGAPTSENFGFYHREGQPSGESVELNEDQIAARKKRNVAIAWSLVGFMVVIFLVTVARLSQNVSS